MRQDGSTAQLGFEAWRGGRPAYGGRLPKILNFLRRISKPTQVMSSPPGRNLCENGKKNLKDLQANLHFTVIRKDAGLYCGSRLRSGEVFAYVGRNQNLKDLKDSGALVFGVSVARALTGVPRL